MKTPTVQTHGATGNTSQETKIGKEGLNMKAQTGKAKVRISQALGHSIGGRFFRVAALGALLVGAAALYTSMSQGEAGGQPAGSETTQAFEARGNWVQRDEAEERLYDENREAFVGIPAYLVPLEDDVAELPYDELSKSFFGVPPIAGKEEVTLSIDQRFPPGTLPED